ncbi:MAG: deoxyribonuclease IV [Candidatus Komeilibacteria bacterium]|nr:deoxyribonuclease IV [Candidatus Komeilibacteria bacterium]
MKFGSHVSIAGGVFNAPANAAKIGCEVFQMFSRSPRGGNPPVLSAEIVGQFKSATKINNQAEAYIHAPYYINLCSTNNRIRYGSIKVIREELERAGLLGVKYVMTHLGSANDLPREEAVKEVTEGIIKILNGCTGSTLFLMENSAGSGNVMGDQFEELALIINGIPRSARDKIGICLDTCHAFASGYDLRNKESINQTIKKFDSIIGLKYLKLIHANDSKTELGKRVDRHEHLGQGKIGLAGFKALVNHPKLKNINFIVETDDEGVGQAGDLKLLKQLRNKK